MKKSVVFALVFVALFVSVCFAQVWDSQNVFSRSTDPVQRTAASTTLTSSDMIPGRVFVNMGVSDNSTWVLPECTAANVGIGGEFVSLVSTHKVFLDPVSGDDILPTGSDNQTVVSSGTAGDYYGIKCMLTSTGSYNWYRILIGGTWAGR